MNDVHRQEVKSNLTIIESQHDIELVLDVCIFWCLIRMAGKNLKRRKFLFFLFLKRKKKKEMK